MTSFAKPAGWFLQALRVDGKLVLKNEGKSMNDQEPILEEKVLKDLVRDIGLANTRKFMESLDREMQSRIQKIKDAVSIESLEELAAQAHSLKSSAQISGAYRLAVLLVRIETTAKKGQTEAFALAKEALNTAELTRFAYLDVKLSD